MSYEWDPEKAEANHRKLHIDFADAVAALETGAKMRKHYDFSKGKRGSVVSPDPGKTRITIRLDEDIIDWFREQVNAAGGGNYQTLINKALREFVEQRSGGEPLEKTLRRVIREELRKKGAA